MAACVPQVTAIDAAPERVAGQRPAHGWQAVTLPDSWFGRWPGVDTVWYRLQWQHPCPDLEPVALTVGQLIMAGVIQLNDTLLWRDASLHEPFSRSWNMPRYWVLPDAALAENNVLWIRVTGMTHDILGLGEVQLGSPEKLWPQHIKSVWQKRYLFVLNLSSSLALGCLFLALWAVRRNERAFGWYAVASLAWALFAATMLATSPWPFTNSSDWNRGVSSVLVVYVSAFCFFTWHFGGQYFPRLTRLFGGGSLLVMTLLWLLPDDRLTPVLVGVIPGYSLIFLANCVQFQWHAWHHRQRHNVLLALCLLCFIIIGIHDMSVLFGLINKDHFYSPVTSPIAMLFMFLIVADRFARNLRRIETFNTDLQHAIDNTRAELTQTLQRKHQLETSNIRLTERLRLSHDLHDSLGSSLMRSIILVQQADGSISNTRFLSMLKELRDDLRQIIDNTSPSATSENTTPTEWIAPLRHRFVRLFDELGLTSHWHLPAYWPRCLSSVQLLALTRFLEEALTNAIRHSQCQQLEIRMQATGDGGLLLQVYDDGKGFDTEALVGHCGNGMNSMQARVARIGGRLDIDSRPGRTCLSVFLGESVTDRVPAVTR